VSEAIAGRTALVTGGGSGLGAAIAGGLVQHGATVIVVGRDRAKLDAVAAHHGGAVRAAVCDVADADSVAALAAQLADEQVSILINNAGIPGPVAALTEIEPAEWDEVFAVNVRGVYLMCRAFLPAMLDRGRGDVINLASVSGKRPLARRTPYCASKMAVIGLTTTLAAEVGPHGVNINSLSRPGRQRPDAPKLPPRSRPNRQQLRGGRACLRLPGGPRPDGHRGRGRTSRHRHAVHAGPVRRGHRPLGRDGCTLSGGFKTRTR